MLPIKLSTSLDERTDRQFNVTSLRTHHGCSASHTNSTSRHSEHITAAVRPTPIQRHVTQNTTRLQCVTHQFNVTSLRTHHGCSASHTSSTSRHSEHTTAAVRPTPIQRHITQNTPRLQCVPCSHHGGNANGTASTNTSFRTDVFSVLLTHIQMSMDTYSCRRGGQHCLFCNTVRLLSLTRASVLWRWHRNAVTHFTAILLLTSSWETRTNQMHDFVLLRYVLFTVFRATCFGELPSSGRIHHCII
jgi:hypothetical protein